MTKKTTPRSRSRKKSAPKPSAHSTQWTPARIVGTSFGVFIALGTVFSFGFGVSEFLHKKDSIKFQDAMSRLSVQESEYASLELEYAALGASEASAVTAMNELKDSIQRKEPIERSLREVVRERESDWGGKFEQLYAPSTVFMLRERRPDSELMGVYGQIIRWRLGANVLPAQDMALLSLTGFAYQADPLGDRTPSEYIDQHVDRVLLDKDLLAVTLDVEDGKAVFNGELILGEPASGKTTLLKYLELFAGRNALADPDAPLPVRIDLGRMESSDYDSVIANIEETARRYAAPDAPGFVLPEGRQYLLLIDSLDEAPDIEAAAQACIRLSQDTRVSRIVLTCRIVNYDMQLRSDHRLDPALHGFRTFLLYGQSLAAVEKRVLAKRSSGQRRQLLEILSDPIRRPIWLQFFRLPSHFDFATEFLVDADIDQLTTPNRTGLLENYINSKMRTVEWTGWRPDPSEVNRTMAAIAGEVFPSRQFADLQIREAIGSRREYTLIVQEEIREQLTFAKKIGLIETIPDGYAFRHNQFLEYYTAMNDRGVGDTPWHEVDVKDLAFREVLLFRVGRREGREELMRIMSEAEYASAAPGDTRLVQYMIPFAVQCVDSSPFSEDPVMRHRRMAIAETPVHAGDD